MPIRRLRLQNVRNIGFADIQLGEGFNCFVGANGAGKTTALESVYLIGRGRSFRSASLDSVVQHDADKLSVFIDLQTGAAVDTILVNKQRRQPLVIQMNGQRTAKVSDVAVRLPLQLLTPDVSELVFAGPAERRRYLDWGLFHVEHRYHALARDYSRALSQRNTWLRDNYSTRDERLDPWAEVLQDLALEVDYFRQSYCLELFEMIRNTAHSLDIGIEPEFIYQKGWKSKEGVSYAELLQESAIGDVKSGATRIGPHRADITVKSGGYDADQTLSRGQAKLVAIAMKVAQVELLRRKTGKQSTVLFDELIAELDYQRTGKVLEMLARSGCQVIISSVELPDAIKRLIGNQARLFHVKQGAITALEE
jgi:DNA replication and repair protein RecF